jgi:hypothetical protein
LAAAFPDHDDNPEFTLWFRTNDGHAVRRAERRSCKLEEGGDEASGLLARPIAVDGVGEEYADADDAE